VNEKLLADRLSAVANHVDDSDWLDVKRRVSYTPRRPRRGASLAAILVGTLVLAGAALGLGYQFFDLSLGDPAPEPVQRSFDMWEEHRKLAEQHWSRRHRLESRLDIPTREARLVGRLRARNGRRVLFWAAPTQRGWCHLVQYLTFRKPAQFFAQGGCGRGRQFDLEYHSFVGGKLFAGRVRPAVTNLLVFVGSGPGRRVRLTNGFYVFDTPDGTPIRIVGRDVKGRVAFLRNSPKP
jgi:hypothetical protein